MIHHSIGSHLLVYCSFILEVYALLSDFLHIYIITLSHLSKMITLIYSYLLHIPLLLTFCVFKYKFEFFEHIFVYTFFSLLFKLSRNFRSLTFIFTGVQRDGNSMCPVHLHLSFQKFSIIVTWFFFLLMFYFTFRIFILIPWILDYPLFIWILHYSWDTDLTF